MSWPTLHKRKPVVHAAWSPLPAGKGPASSRTSCVQLSVRWNFQVRTTSYHHTSLGRRLVYSPQWRFVPKEEWRDGIQAPDKHMDEDAERTSDERPWQRNDFIPHSHVLCCFPEANFQVYFHCRCDQTDNQMMGTFFIVRIKPRFHTYLASPLPSTHTPTMIL